MFALAETGTDMACELHDVRKDTDSIIEMLHGIKREDKSMNDAFGLAALMNNRNNNGVWDNPLIYLIWLAMFAGRGCGGGLFGGGGDCGQAAQTEMLNSLGEVKAGLAGAEMQNNQLINEVGRIAQSMGYNKDFVTAAIAQNKDAICNYCSQLQTALCRNGYETAMQLCNVGNMVQSGTAQVVQAIQNCCCQTNLGIERTGNSIERLIDRTSCNTDKEILGLGTATNAQFANLNFNNQLQTNAVLSAIQADGEKTRALIQQNRFDEVVRERDAALLQLSQNAQTNNIRDYVAQLLGGRAGTPAGTASFGWTAQPSALNPNGSQAYPYYVNNTPTTTTTA